MVPSQLPEKTMVDRAGDHDSQWSHETPVNAPGCRLTEPTEQERLRQQTLFALRIRPIDF